MFLNETGRTLIAKRYDPMNRYAYRTTSLAIKTFSGLIHPNINIHDVSKIPSGNPVIFVLNHFTRAETVLVPYHINRLTGRTIWALASDELFIGGFGRFLESLGAVSTKSPDRDRLIVKTLLTNEAAWIIFPEGRMVKNKKIFEVINDRGEFMIASSAGKHPPHTGAATLGMRTEFYRNRILKMDKIYPDEAKRLLALYQIDSIDAISRKPACIVPVNITYYPIRAKENLLSRLAKGVFENLSDRTLEELMAEGTMLFSGTDIDIRFGDPIFMDQYVNTDVIRKNIELKAKIDFNDSISAKHMMRLTAVHVMKRYMSAIYSMTTVNHDHIFASLLKHLPGTHITKDDLRARAYLVTTRLASLETPTFKHSSLDKSQIHLLTDDCHNKFENFLSIALETGTVKEDGNTLIKNEKIFSAPPDFHTARIDNPVVVIANEVEPLVELQKTIHEIAVDTTENIRHAVAKHIIQLADFEFERDYSRFFIEGESKKKNVGRPFLLRNENSPVGVVLIHGYMAAPMEVRALALHIHKNIGCNVYAPRLRGHGTSPNDLATRPYTDWTESVDEGYAILKNMCEKVIVGGFSMGAGLALELASRIDNLAGVFAISPPMRLQDFSTRLVPAINLWNRLMKKMNLDAPQKEFVKNIPENPEINYHSNPLSGIVELEKLMDSTAPRLSRIKVPTLIIQSHSDPVVNPGGSHEIFKNISSKQKEYLLVNIERHGIINGDGSERIFHAVEDFMTWLLADDRHTTP